MVCILLVKILQESWISKIIRIRITAVTVPVPDPAWTRIPLASNIIYDNGEEFALQQICINSGFLCFQVSSNLLISDKTRLLSAKTTEIYYIRRALIPPLSSRRLEGR
jgi:hypothetical protein